MNRQEYFEEFKPFFEAICVELERHDPEKGSTWKETIINGLHTDIFLKSEFLEHYRRYKFLSGIHAAAHEVDLAALLGMLWLRRPKEDQVSSVEAPG